MALMRNSIDKRTLATIVTNANAQFAHGLGVVPDAVLIRHVATLASTTSWMGGLIAVIDATNVTIYNGCAATSGVIEVCTMSFHSIIQ
jgi:hypothetical protein